MTFIAPGGNIPAITYGQSLVETLPNPAIFLNDTSTNGQLETIVNVAGNLWFIKNGYYNGSQFLPINTTLPSYALEQNASGGFQMWESALVGGVAQNPLVWVLSFTVDLNGTITSLGNINLPTSGLFGNIFCQNITVSGLISGNIGVGSIANLGFIRAGSAANVLCDGTTPAANTINFATAFPNSLQGSPELSISAVSAAGQTLGTPECSGLSVNGFTVYIPGGYAGTTCTVTYWADGT